MPHKPPADDADWLEETKTVTRLGHPKPSQHHRRRAVQPPTQTYLPPSSRHQPIAILSHHAKCIAGLADNLDPKLLKDLALGKYPPTAKLDLHGVKEGDAWLRLMSWLSDAILADHRCVLIITGKGRGYGPEGDMGLIKAQSPQWIAAHPQVMAFHTAQPEDGGSGALYVFLRRHRS